MMKQQVSFRIDDNSHIVVIMEDDGVEPSVTAFLYKTIETCSQLQLITNRPIKLRNT